jgi:hypothetical protein
MYASPTEDCQSKLSSAIRSSRHCGGSPFFKPEDAMRSTLRCTAPLLALCVAFAAVPAGAQSDTRPAIRVLGGVTGASLEDESTETDPLYGLAVGVQYLRPLRGPWAIAPELLLLEKGGSQSAGGASVDADLRTVDVSLLLRWSTGNTESRRRVFAFGGPTLGYVLSCDAGASGGGVAFTGNCLDAVNRQDLGVTIGGGLEFPTSSIDWGLSLRYQHGIADLLAGPGTVRARTVVLLLSYRL